MDRRVFFRKSGIAFGGLMIGSLLTINAHAKQSKDVANYQKTPKDGEKCSDCTYFIKPDSCKVVEGSVKEDGWCKLYHKKDK
ncbi:MAG: high-potential iron-sulfur protein [Campylobacterales bacterium]